MDLESRSFAAQALYSFEDALLVSGHPLLLTSSMTRSENIAILFVAAISIRPATVRMGIRHRGNGMIVAG
ncbi:MAG: hypothetical protein JO227_18920 [Acetobacteraceae bacterium]|nr:hypothetical protein [Acetobacteraceae bacterium]